MTNSILIETGSYRVVMSDDEEMRCFNEGPSSLAHALAWCSLGLPLPDNLVACSSRGIASITLPPLGKRRNCVSGGLRLGEEFYFYDVIRSGDVVAAYAKQATDTTRWDAIDRDRKMVRSATIMTVRGMHPL